MLKAYDYIKCYQNTFWKWDRNGAFVQLKEGSIFAHWEEVKQHLNLLAPSGLPLFDVYLGLLAAVKADEFSNVHQIIPESLEPNRSNQVIRENYHILDVIKDVDKKYKEGNNAFLMVAALANEVNLKIVEHISANIIEELQDPHRKLFGAKGEIAIGHMKKVARCFRLLSEQFPNPESVVAAMMGMDPNDFDMEAVIPRTEESNSEVSDHLLDQLQEDARTQKMAALIPYVISGLNFPIHASQSDDRPEGGVSDLSNKGHFDQLIVTEHAYEEDYFLSRIVNNEALFYQREKAKNDNNESVCVLIDASIYMWGVPKLLATSIACAVGLKEEKSEVHCFVVGSELIPCNFYSLDGVLKSIHYTNASICPAEGLDLFELEQATSSYSNTLFITTPQSWKRPEMMRIRDVSKQLFDFIVYTNEEAEVNVLKSKGKNVVQFKLDLKSIWEVKRKDKSVPSRSVNTNYPVLFPVSTGRIKYYFNYGEDIFFIDKSRGLFKIQQTTDAQFRGAQFILQLDRHLAVLGDIGHNDRGEYELLMFSPKRSEIIIYNLSDSSEKRYEFPQWKQHKNGIFHHVKNTFYFVDTNGCFLIDDQFSPKSPMIAPEPQLYRSARARSLNIKNRCTFQQNYYKSARDVFISDQSELVIQNKRIEASNERIQFEFLPAGKKQVLPVLTHLGEHQTFTFDSGERIEIHPSGMTIFHFDEARDTTCYELFLNSVNPSDKLRVVKAIKTFTGRTLLQAKELVDNGRGTIRFSRSKEELHKMAKDLKDAECHVDVQPMSLGKSFYMPSVDSLEPALASETFFTGNDMFQDLSLSRQKKIDAFEFHDLYLQPFIKNIQNEN